MDLTDAAARNAAGDLVQVARFGTLHLAYHVDNLIICSTLSSGGTALKVQGQKKSRLLAVAAIVHRKVVERVLMCLHQGLFTDMEGTPAKDRDMAAATMKLARQVSSSAGELAGTVLDAIAACLRLGEPPADGAEEAAGPGIRILCNSKDPNDLGTSLDDALT